MDENTYTLAEIEAEKRRRALEQLARYDYRYYLRYAYGKLWRETRFSDFISGRAQAFLEADTGNAYDILVLNTPPQHGKSWTITESLPSWWLGRHPDDRIIIASYNDESAERFCRANRQKILEVGAGLFGLQLRGKVQATEFALGGGFRGSLLSRGMKSGITGNPADIIIIDDPIKNMEEADSESARKKLWEGWKSALQTRLSAGAKVILIMTPWHEDDLAGRILRTEPNITQIRLPVEAEENDPMGRSPGDPLCPELGKDKKWLDQFKESYLNDPTNGGSRAWTAMFMCSPRVEGGHIIKREWWKRYNPDERKSASFGTTIISVDAAFKGRENNDFVSVQVWSKSFAQYFLRYGINKHLTFTETVAEIKRIRRLYPEVGYVVIEDKANGSAIIEVLQHEMTGVVGISPKGGKEARVHAVEAAIETGCVLLPETAFAEELIDQFAAFPAAPHDDMVDACTQALSFLLYRNGGELPVSEEAARRQRMEGREALALCDNNALYNPYSGDGIGGYGGIYEGYGGIY